MFQVDQIRGVIVATCDRTRITDDDLDAFSLELSVLLRTCVSKMLLDLSRATYICSGALGKLITFRNNMAVRGSQLRVRAVAEVVDAWNIINLAERLNATTEPAEEVVRLFSEGE